MYSYIAAADIATTHMNKRSLLCIKLTMARFSFSGLTFSMYGATLAGVLSYKGEGETNGYLGPNNFIDPSTGFKGPLANLS